MKGVKRPGAGRKPIEDEDRIRDLYLSALERVYGSKEEAFEYIAEKSRESFPHLKLTFEYRDGKPKEVREIRMNTEQPVFHKIPILEFFRDVKDEK